MLVARGTKKLLDRAGRPIPDDIASTGVLGDWYANALFWRPKSPVRERAHPPAGARAAGPRGNGDARLPAAFAKIARRLDVEALTLEGELAAMAEQVLAKTSSRSVLGVMNEFARMADSYRWTEDHIDLAELSRWLAQRGSRIATEGPHRSPAQIDPELEAAISAAQGPPT